MRNNIRRGRAAASLAVTAAMVGTALAVGSGPAASTVPVDNTCNEAVPVDEIAKGDVVDGLTVSDGTEPDPFAGEILGVIEDGIAPGLDMVMARLDSSALDAAGGVWSGMSGSPVYAADGRLVGAVAYGLSWGPSMVAGITPYAEMDDYLPTAPRPRIKVTDRQARAIAQGSEVSARQAEEGFSQLRLPQRVAGLSQQRMEALDGRTKFRKNSYLVKKFAGLGGGIAPASSDAGDLVPGGNLAVSMAHGTVTMGGVGTVTAVCGDDLVGFGHPATFLGTTSLTLHPADALYVQEESLGSPFKVANFGEPAGTIDQDHLAGIAGFVGVVPESTDITHDVTWTPAPRSRSGETHVSVPEANASAVFYQHLALHDRVIDGISPGSELTSWEMTGTDADGSPFTLAMTDRFASDYDIAWSGSWELADLVWVLSAMPDVSIDSVDVTNTVDDDSSTWRLRTVEQRQKGEWVKLSRRHPAVAVAGQPMTLRTTLEGPGGTSTTQMLELLVPKKAKRRGVLAVAGGGSRWTDIYGAANVDEVAEALAAAVRNDAVVAELGRGTKAVRAVSEPLEHVVHGRKFIGLKVRR